MIYSIKLIELSNKINPFVFIRYLKDTGWHLFPRKRSDIKVFQMEIEDDFYQVTIPIDKELSDYNESMYKAVEMVAAIEHRSVEQLLLYLLNPSADILKIRLDKKNVEAGNILFDDAIRIYENAKKLVGAAALDVIHPRRYHRGRMDDSVSQFLSTCRFGQTEVGSYIVSVICPFAQLNDKKEYELLSLFSDENEFANSFTRKVTDKIMTNISRIKKSIDEDELAALSDEKDSIISANFYEALLGLNLDSADSNIEFIAEWSPAAKNNNLAKDHVVFSNNYYQPIEAIAKKLKTQINKSTKIIGRIKKLESSPDIKVRKTGKITIVYLNEKNQPRTVTAKLDNQNYTQALIAHEKGLYVELIGELSGKTRPASMVCESFNIID